MRVHYESYTQYQYLVYAHERVSCSMHRRSLRRTRVESARRALRPSAASSSSRAPGASSQS